MKKKTPPPLAKNESPASETPRVSVIMRTKNSDWVVAQALSGLFSQDFQDFELIVVDSGSTDRTLEIVRRFPCRLIEIEPEDYYPGAVLNMAASEARGSLLVFQNSDVVPLSKETLSRLVSAFDDPEVQAAFARQIPRPEAVSWVRRDYALSFPDRGEAPPWIKLSLPLAAMRKEIWEEHPFYTEAWASEDTEWGAWAQRQGHKVKYVPEATVMHSHNYTLRQIYGRRYVEGEADAFIFGKRDSWSKMLGRTLRSMASDLPHHLASQAWSEVPLIPLRRFVYHWAYYKGHRLGEERRESGNKDASQAQQVIFSHYGGQKL